MKRFLQGENPTGIARSWLIVLSVLILVLIWSGVSPGATDLRALLPTKDLPAGWALIQGPQVYTKRNLFEHVDGQAVLYMKYGFQRSVFAIFENLKSTEDQIEVDIYDMGTVLNAFGVFSRFRNDHRPGGIGFDSYFDDRSVLFYKGKYFVMLYATETDASILKQLAMMISSKIVDSSPPPKEISFFQKDGLRPDSIQYFSEGLLGHDFLGRGFQASYIINKDKDEVKAEVKAEDKGEIEDKMKDKVVEGHRTKGFDLFLAIFKSPKDAKSGLKAYENYISKRGRILPGIPAGFGPDAWRGEDPYRGQLIVVQKGFYLMGTIGFTDKSGEVCLDKFFKGIR